MLEQLLQIYPGLIDTNPEQPREHFAPSALESLVASIKEHGILEPLVVTRLENGGFLLIAGERRLRAALALGLETVPVVVRQSEGENRLELALIENLQRADLDPMEAGRGYQRLIHVYGYSQEQVAVRVGLDRATVANTLRLLKLPESGQSAVRTGKISAGHGRALVMLQGEAFDRALKQVIEGDLSVRQTERLVKSLLVEKKKPAGNRSLERGVEQLALRLSRRVSSKVKIETRKDGGGRVVISYATVEELNRIADILEGE